MKGNFSKIAVTADQASSTDAAYSEHVNSYSFKVNGGLRKQRTGYCQIRTPSPSGKQYLLNFDNIDR